MIEKTKKIIINKEYPLNLLEMIAYKESLDVPDELTQDIIDGVNYVLSKLSEREKELIHLRYVEKKKHTEIAEIFAESKEIIQKTEKSILSKLQIPYLWHYMCYGILGNTNRREERAYQNGYENGYRCGVQDERDGRVDADGKYDPMKLPISNMRLPPRALNCLKKAGFVYVGEVASLSHQSIEKLKCLGPSGRSIIAYTLHRLGLEHTDWACYY